MYDVRCFAEAQCVVDVHNHEITQDVRGSIGAIVMRKLKNKYQRRRDWHKPKIQVRALTRSSTDFNTLSGHAVTSFG